MSLFGLLLPPAWVGHAYLNSQYTNMITAHLLIYSVFSSDHLVHRWPGFRRDLGLSYVFRAAQKSQPLPGTTSFVCLVLLLNLRPHPANLSP